MKQMNIRQAKLVETFQYRVGNDGLKNNTLEFYGWTVCANTQLLLINGTDVNVEERSQFSLYSYKCTAQLLLNNNAEVNLRMEERAGPLCIACQNGHENTTKLIKL